jgi:hypothetical protein
LLVKGERRKGEARPVKIKVLPREVLEPHIMYVAKESRRCNGCEEVVERNLRWMRRREWQRRRRWRRTSMGTAEVEKP